MVCTPHPAVTAGTQKNWKDHELTRKPTCLSRLSISTHGLHRRDCSVSLSFVEHWKHHLHHENYFFYLSWPSFKGELNPEMKLSQSIELFVTKRMPPFRSLSNVWFSSCASWKLAATPPQFGRDTPFWRHWHSDWLEGDREKAVSEVFQTSQHLQAPSFQDAFVGPFYASNDGFWKLWHFFIFVWRRFCSHFLLINGNEVTP